MVENIEKMVLVSSASSEWQQNNQIDDQKMGSVGATVGGRAMDPQLQKQQNQEPLRCPRCDSSNTKFCYYNNYNLSQPRHFCKACKRYWTKGGTLRNVPVGGGCRKNKRVKRPPNTSSLIDSSNSSSSGGQIHDLIPSSSSNHVNPLFYGLPTNHNPNSEINFPFSRYDIQNPPQINGLGLGFSSSSYGLVHNMNGDCEESRNHQASKKISQDLVSSNPLFSNYTNTTTLPTTISSLLASNIHMKGANNFQTLLSSYEDNPQMRKEVKMEFEGQNRSIDHDWSSPNQNQVDQNMGLSSDHPYVLWGSTGANLGAWLDPSNPIGS